MGAIAKGILMERPQERSGDNLYPVSLRAQLGPHHLNLDVPEGVWNPTPNGIHLGNVLANYDFSEQHVLELGTGCGIHAIVMARQGAARMTLTEIDQQILENARYNLRKHDVTCPVEYVVADWVQVGGGPFDVLVTNPPFAKSGKRYRRYFIDTLILDAHKLIHPAGKLLFVHSSMADVARTIQLMEQCGMVVNLLGEVDGPFRDYYFEDPLYIKEIATVPGAYDIRNGTYFERLVVFEGTLPD